MSIYNKDEWIGKRYGMLVVKKAVNKKMTNNTSQWFWSLKCDCGGEITTRPIEVINGRVVSCGCYRKSRMSQTKKHGESHTPLHSIWCGMNNRCNPNNAKASGYGARGIKVCDEWSSFEKFKEWALQNGYVDGLTIERTDVDGDYCPDNCSWIPLAIQARNRRTTMWVTYEGREMSLAEAAELAGIPYKQVHGRIKKYGWSVERALSEPIKRKSELHIKCDELGLNYHTVYNRIRMGWSEEDAINIPIEGCGANQTTYK